MQSQSNDLFARLQVDIDLLTGKFDTPAPDDASFLTGVCLDVDGGRSIS